MTIVGYLCDENSGILFRHMHGGCGGRGAGHSKEEG
jgi:hypothetical protein